MRREIFWVALATTALGSAVADAQQALENLEKQLAQPAVQPLPPPVPAPPRGVNAPAAAKDEPGYLGIIADDQDTEGRGVRLIDVLAGGPAALGGLKLGDLITSIDGVAVGSLDDMAGVMHGRVVGEEVTFVVIRDGEAARIDVVLTKRPPPEERRFANFGRIQPDGTVVNPPPGESPSGAPGTTSNPHAPASRIVPGPSMLPTPGGTPRLGSANTLPPPGTISAVPQLERPTVAPPIAAPPGLANQPSVDSAVGPMIAHPNSPEAVDARTGLLGIRTARVTPELQLSMNLPEPRGALVIEVRPDSPARAAGIPVDAVIVAIDAKRVNDPNDLLAAVRERGAGAEVRLSYYRYGQLYERRVKLEAPPSTNIEVPQGSLGSPSAAGAPAANVPQAAGPKPTPAKMEPVDDPAAAVKAAEAEKIRRQIEELEAQLKALKQQLNDAPKK